MTAIDRDYLESALVDLANQRREALASLAAVDGARQLVEHLLERLEEVPGETGEPEEKTANGRA